MTRLVARSLATWATGGTSLILHDLQRDLIHKRREKDLPGLHLRLVEAWNAMPKRPDAYGWKTSQHQLSQRATGDNSIPRVRRDGSFADSRNGGETRAAQCPTVSIVLLASAHSKDRRCVAEATSARPRCG
jgi:hypothetical protein